MRFTNWDKYKDNREICRKVECGDEELKWCCPDLDCSLCKPKANLLKKLEIKEKVDTIEVSGVVDIEWELKLPKEIKGSSEEEVPFIFERREQS